MWAESHYKGGSRNSWKSFLVLGEVDHAVKGFVKRFGVVGGGLEHNAIEFNLFSAPDGHGSGGVRRKEIHKHRKKKTKKRVKMQRNDPILAKKQSNGRLGGSGGQKWKLKKGGKRTMAKKNSKKKRKRGFTQL